VPHPVVPGQLRLAPFVGARAVAAGLVTRRQLTGDTWRRLFPNVYVWRGLPPDHRVRCVAAGLFLRGRGAVSGRDAATLWGADILLPGAPVEVTVPNEARFRTQPGLRVVRSSLPRLDCGVEAGVPLTTPRRTAFDLARRLGLVEAVVGVDAMLAVDLVTETEIAYLAGCRPGWPGIPQIRKVLLLCDAGAESPQESRLRLILIGGGLPRPVTQYEVYDGDRFVARLDLAYPEKRVGIEYDGDQHRSRAVFRNDVRRLNDLRARGWTVLRFTAADMYERHKIVAIVAQVLGG
jgi:hypothetical protein